MVMRPGAVQGSAGNANSAPLLQKAAIPGDTKSPQPAQGLDPETRQQVDRSIALVNKYGPEIRAATERPAVREIWGRMEREATQQNLDPQILAAVLRTEPFKDIGVKLLDALRNR